MKFWRNYIVITYQSVNILTQPAYMLLKLEFLGGTNLWIIIDQS
jgi:hypothetical protein